MSIYIYIYIYIYMYIYVCIVVRHRIWYNTRRLFERILQRVRETSHSVLFSGKIKTQNQNFQSYPVAQRTKKCALDGRSISVSTNADGRHDRGNKVCLQIYPQLSGVKC